jgi:hypothetical protein
MGVPQIYSTETLIHVSNNDICLEFQTAKPIKVVAENINRLKNDLGDDYELEIGKTILIKEDMAYIYLTHEHAKDLAEKILEYYKMIKTRKDGDSD